jgi:hypothetical protein
MWGLRAREGVGRIRDLVLCSWCATIHNNLSASLYLLKNSEREKQREREERLDIHWEIILIYISSNQYGA